jgi:hypothetical protein
LGCDRKLGDVMSKLNATLHDAIVTGEQQGGQAIGEQPQQNAATAYKGKGGSSLATLFKQMSHALYLWMD